MNTIQINPADNVIVALSPLAKGTAVAVPGVGEVVAAEDIPQGHKMAVRSIAAGEDVIKYGLPIGHVTGDVQPGQWLHTHNVKTNLSGEVEYTYNPTHPVVEPVEPETFMGFRRADGRAATRNELWIIPRSAVSTKSPVLCASRLRIWSRARLRRLLLPASLWLLADRRRPCPDPSSAGGTVASRKCRGRAVPVARLRELHASAGARRAR